MIKVYLDWNVMVGMKNGKFNDLSEIIFDNETSQQSRISNNGKVGPTNHTKGLEKSKLTCPTAAATGNILIR